MKSTLKIHYVTGFQLVTGALSIEDFRKAPDYSSSGRSQNYSLPCPAPERQYKNKNIEVPFKKVGACFVEHWHIDPEVVAILYDIITVKNSYNMQEKQTLGHVFEHRIDARLCNVKKLDTAEERVKDVNDEFRRWLRDEKEETVRNALHDKVDKFNEQIEKQNKNSISEIAKFTVQCIGDSDNNGLGDPEILELDASIKSILETVKILEDRKLVRRHKLCDELLDMKVGGLVPKEFIETLRAACHNHEQRER
jgi:hypothetical protein